MPSQNTKCPLPSFPLPSWKNRALCPHALMPSQKSKCPLPSFPLPSWKNRALCPHALMPSQKSKCPLPSFPLPSWKNRALCPHALIPSQNEGRGKALFPHEGRGRRPMLWSGSAKLHSRFLEYESKILFKTILLQTITIYNLYGILKTFILIFFMYFMKSFINTT
jgi:hypothetical protein